MLAELRRWMRKRRTWLLTLSAIVVFCTTYALILPAVTLEQQEAARQGGIDVVTEEQNEHNADTQDANAATDKPDTEEIQKPSNNFIEGDLSFEGDGFSITAACNAKAGLPLHTELAVTEIGKKDKDYDALCDEALAAVKTEEGDSAKALKFAYFYDISLMADGAPVAPEAPVDVAISYEKALRVSDAQDLRIVHFGVDKKGRPQTEVLPEDAVDLTTKAGSDKASVLMTEAGFKTDSPSLYAVVGTTIEKTVLASDGHNYKVTASYGPEAGIPAGADLSVTEITKDSAAYDAYVSNTENALGMEEGSAGYIRLFDIKIINKDNPGEKYQPADGSTVDVKIELADADKKKELRVVHFPDGSEEGAKVESSTESGEIGSAVEFAAGGFSIYAVVDEEEIADESRMTLNFYGKDQTTPLATVYVKNSDSLELLKDIIYDPGAGDIDSDEMFRGWIIDKADYNTEDSADAKDIEEIREWAEEKEIAEGEEHNIYAMIYKTYSVIFKDEDGVTIHSEALIFKTGEPATYTINTPYTPKSQDAEFQGWYWTSTSQNAVVPTDGTSTVPYPNGTEVQINDNVVFMPTVPNGYWLSFNENGRGVSYTPPQFVPAEGPTVSVKPNDPSRQGYRFKGWNTAADGSGESWLTVNYSNNGTASYSNNKFGEKLDGRTTLYAQWEALPTAPYTVIIWKENVNGDGYDFEESIQLTGTVGEDVSSVTQQGTGDNAYARISVGNTNRNIQYTGFHLKEFDQNVEIVPEGNAVVNVYYDRTEYTFTFKVEGGYTYEVSSNDNDNTPEKYGDVNGQKQRIYWRNRAFRTSNNNNGTVYNGTVYTRTPGQIIHTVKRKYQADISDIWSFTGSNGVTYPQTNPVTSWQPSGSSVYTARITRMETMPAENITFTHTTTSNTTRYFHYYVEALPGAVNTRTYNGLEYSLYLDLPNDFNIVFYNDDFWELNGFTRQAVVKANASGTAYYSVPLQPGEDMSWDGYNTGWFSTYVEGLNDYGGQDNHLYFFYTRDKYVINYMDGTYVDGNGNPVDEANHGQWNTSEEIYYQANIESYNKGGADYYVPTKAGYVFEGWYLDDACTHPYTFTTMPKGGVTVYAKWRKIQYRVFMHPNVPTEDTSLDWGDQDMSFRVNYGDKIAGGNTINGTRSDYDLIGWYTDAACTHSFNFDAYVLNDTTVRTAYDKTEDTELDKYGNPAQTGNRDLDPNLDGNTSDERFWITKKLDLYAKWRARLEGAEGIHVEYDTVSPEGAFPNGDTSREDPIQYLDNSEAIAGAASVPADSENMQFMYWMIQDWNGTEYEDTETKVYPGDSFTVLKSDAKMEELPAEEQTETVKNKYTVRLKAVYGPKEAPTPTHITWYANNGTGDVVTDSTLQINEAVDIKPANTFTREGYRFIGWARLTEVNENGEVTTIGGVPPANLKLDNLGESDLFLKYDHVTGKYVATANTGVQVGKTISKIAADENLDYHGMVAVWEKTYTVTVKKIVVGSDDDKDIDFGFTENHNIDGVSSSEPFSLKDGDEKIYENTFPVGSHFSVSETENADFDISVAAEYTDDDGAKHNITQDSSGNEFVNGSDIAIQGDTTITVTNTRKAKRVKIHKIDDSDTPVSLEEVGFILNGKLLTTDEDGYTPVETLIARGDPYVLSEAYPIEHYTKLNGNVSVTVGEAGVTATALDESDADKVSVSGPDGDGVYTITVVNPRERYDVTVVKTVRGITTDQNIGFDFSAVGLSGTTETFTLYGEAKEAEGDEPKHLHEVTYDGIPYGTIIALTETTEDSDFVTSINIENGDDSSAVSDSKETGNITVEGDVVVTYTNARNKIPIKVVKTDQENIALAGAKFEGDLINGTITTAVSDDEAVIIDNDAVPVGNYTISETEAPAGYYPLEGEVTIVVDNNGTDGDLNVSASIKDATRESITVERDTDHPEDGYLITIRNYAGVALPHTGGSGTRVYTVLGLILVLGSGLLLLRRRRMLQH